MSDKPYDRSSKWLLEHQGRGLAIVGGMSEVISCKSIQAEVVHPLKLPDGLLEVKQRGRSEPRLLLVEFCTYPESRTARQMLDDIMLVVQARKVLPEVLALVLCQKGAAQVLERHKETSDLGWTSIGGKWKVQELWKLSAEEMLAVPDIGVVPWVPLMAFDGPPEPLLRRCRDRIDREGGDQKPNLLAVAQVLTRLKYPQPALLDLFGGSRIMIESPLIQEIEEKAERRRAHAMIERFIQARFGKLSDAARAMLQSVSDEERLNRLVDFAAVCQSRDEFVERLTKEITPAPAPVSSRRKKKS
jgi:predicted transposase YdaD